MATAVDCLPGIDVLTEEEKKKILSVIRRDDELRRAQDSKLNFIKQEINTLRMKSVLRSGDDLSKMCARCHSQFSFLFNRGELCPKCSFRVCRLCKIQMLNGGWLCTLCYKSVQIKLTTGDWMRGMNTKRSIKRWASGSDLVKAALNATPTDGEVRRRKSDVAPLGRDEDEVVAAQVRGQSKLSKSSHQGAKSPEDMKRPKESDKKRLTALVDSFKSSKKPDVVEKIMVRKVTSKRYSDSDASSSEDDSELTSEMNPVKTSSQRSSPIHSSDCNHSNIKAVGASSFQPNSVLPGSQEHSRPDSRATTISYTESWRSSPEQSPGSNRRFSTESSESQSSNAQTVLHMKRESGFSTRSNSSASERSITTRDPHKAYAKSRRQGVLRPDLPENKHDALNTSLTDSVSSTPSRSSQGGKTRLLDMALSTHRRQDSSGSEVTSSPGRPHSSGTDGEYTVEESSKIRFKRISKQTVTKVQAMKKASVSSGLPIIQMDSFGEQQSRKKKIVIPEEGPPYDSSDSGNSENDFNFTPKSVTSTNSYYSNHDLSPSLHIYCDSVVQVAIHNAYRLLAQFNSDNQSVFQKSFESPGVYNSPENIYGKLNKKKSFRSRKIVHSSNCVDGPIISARFLKKETHDHSNSSDNELENKPESEYESSLESNFSVSKMQEEVEKYLARNSNIRSLSEVSSESGYHLSDYSYGSSDSEEEKPYNFKKNTVTTASSESTSGLDNPSLSVSEGSDTNSIIEVDKKCEMNEGQSIDDVELPTLSLADLSSAEHRLKNSGRYGFCHSARRLSKAKNPSPLHDLNNRQLSGNIFSKNMSRSCDDVSSLKSSNLSDDSTSKKQFPFPQMADESLSDNLSPIEEVSEVSSNDYSVINSDVSACSSMSSSQPSFFRSPASIFSKIRKSFFNNKSPTRDINRISEEFSNSSNPVVSPSLSADYKWQSETTGNFLQQENSSLLWSENDKLTHKDSISEVDSGFQNLFHQLSLTENIYQSDSEIEEMYEENRNLLISLVGSESNNTVTDTLLLKKLDDVTSEDKIVQTMGKNLRTGKFHLGKRKPNYDCPQPSYSQTEQYEIKTPESYGVTIENKELCADKNSIATCDVLDEDDTLSEICEEEIHRFLDITESNLSKFNQSVTNSHLNMSQEEIETFLDITASDTSLCNAVDTHHPSYVTFGGQDHSRGDEPNDVFKDDCTCADSTVHSNFESPACEKDCDTLKCTNIVSNECDDNDLYEQSEKISSHLSLHYDHILNLTDQVVQVKPVNSLLVLCLKSLSNPRFMYSEPYHINGIVRHTKSPKQKNKKMFKNNECCLIKKDTKLFVSNSNCDTPLEDVMELEFTGCSGLHNKITLVPLCLSVIMKTMYEVSHEPDIAVNDEDSERKDAQISQPELPTVVETDTVSDCRECQELILVQGSDEMENKIKNMEKEPSHTAMKTIELAAPEVLSKSQTSDDTGSHGEDSGHASGLSQENTPEGRSPNILVHSVSFSDCDQEEDYDIDELVSRTRSYGSKGNLLSIGSESKESLWSMYSNAGEGAFGNIPVTGDIQFALSFNYKSVSLEINVIQCRNIAAVDVKRKRSDPYVKTYLLPDKTRSGKRKSKVKRHTLNPQFNEILRYNITKSELENRTLWVSVWNNDRFGRNDFLGEVTIPLDYFKFDHTSPQWYALESREDTLDSVGLAYKGDIIISLRYVTADHLKKGSSPAKKKGKKPNINTELGQLRVLIKEAKNLSAVRSNGTSDPFCKGYLLPEKHKSMKQKTPVIKKECNPLWNTTFVFDGVSHDELRDRCLELTVWDHDRLTSNDFLGGLRLNLGSGHHQGKQVDWMDAHGEEISIWQAMIDRPNTSIDGSLPLRPSMDKRKS